jgi:hypothetical protein
VEEMEQNDTGIPTTALTGAQAALLSEAEPLAREIGFLAHVKDQTLAGSTLLTLSTMAWAGCRTPESEERGRRSSTGEVGP